MNVSLQIISHNCFELSLWIQRVWWSKFKSDSSPGTLFWQHHVCQPPNLASDQHLIFGIFEHLPFHLCIGPFQKVTKWWDCLNRAITWWDDSKRRTGSKALKADAAFDGQKNSWATISGFSPPFNADKHFFTSDQRYHNREAATAVS